MRAKIIAIAAVIILFISSYISKRNKAVDYNARVPLGDLEFDHMDMPKIHAGRVAIIIATILCL